MIQFTVGTLPCMTTLGGALKHFGVSATLRRRIKHSGTCTCNGQVIGLQNFVHTGDTICISLPVRQAFAPEPLAFTRVYEDRHLLVINKPAGLLMHPTAGQRSGTLANAVSYYYITSNQHCAYHPVHRLDKNTSGLCMIAKNPYVQSLFDHAPNRYYKRLYLALSTGYFPTPTATIHSPVGRAENSIIKRCVCLDGQKAHTDFVRLAAADTYSLLQVSLHTGRTHQIRVHCSYLGFPLLGDDLYGGTHELLSRQALHAYAMLFIHPITHKEIRLFALPPADMQALITEAGWDSLLAALSFSN